MVRKPVFRPALLASFALVTTAQAETWYVSPDGTESEGCTRRSKACSLSAAAAGAQAGDTVVLMDGVYLEPLYVSNTGTADAWITFEADQCATPIIEGPGAGPDDDEQSNGVGSPVAEYIRFRGLVARGWNIGFGNGWVGGIDTEDVSNGHWEIENCISYSNGRTGFTFFSAADFTLKNSIAAHNGSSRLHSWSSGVTLFETTGTNRIEGNISFENTDAQENTDGSGFIVDEEANGALFISNIAFGNAGSCLRLTDSSGTRFVNNTCYHNSQFGGRAMGPSNPGELYFTNAGVTVQGVNFTNNVIIGTGMAPAGPQAVVNQPTSGWTNNIVQTGNVSFFGDPEGASPVFVPAAGETTLTGAGMAGADVPTMDIGLDPRCIVKRSPVMVGNVATESWWQYDIDIDYIMSLGGVAGCFNPKARTGTTDIGAYQSGDVTVLEPGSCVPPPPDPPELDAGVGDAGSDADLDAGVDLDAGTGTGGAGANDTAGAGQGGAAGNDADAGAGGAGANAGTGAGGVGASAGAGGATTDAGAAGSGGVAGTGVSGSGGAQQGTGAGGNAAGASAGAAGVGGSAGAAPSSDTASGGCGCRLQPKPPSRGTWFCSLGLVVLVARRRRAARSS